LLSHIGVRQLYFGGKGYREGTYETVPTPDFCEPKARGLTVIVQRVSVDGIVMDAGIDAGGRGYTKYFMNIGEKETSCVYIKGENDISAEHMAELRIEVDEQHIKDEMEQISYECSAQTLASTSLVYRTYFRAWLSVCAILVTVAVIVSPRLCDWWFMTKSRDMPAGHSILVGLFLAEVLHFAHMVYLDRVKYFYQNVAAYYDILGLPSDLVTTHHSTNEYVMSQQHKQIENAWTKKKQALSEEMVVVRGKREFVEDEIGRLMNGADGTVSPNLRNSDGSPNHAYSASILEQVYIIFMPPIKCPLVLPNTALNRSPLTNFPSLLNPNAQEHKLNELERAKGELFQRFQEVEEAFEAIGGHTSNTWKELCLVARSMEVVATIFAQTALFGHEPHHVDYSACMGLSRLRG
jgi:hypothetical protein